MVSDYITFKKRINKATTQHELDRLDISLDRLWNAGVFTQSEFIRLDSAILDKRDSLKWLIKLLTGLATNCTTVQMIVIWLVAAIVAVLGVVVVAVILAMIVKIAWTVQRSMMISLKSG